MPRRLPNRRKLTPQAKPPTDLTELPGPDQRLLLGTLDARALSWFHHADLDDATAMTQHASRVAAAPDPDGTGPPVAAPDCEYSRVIVFNFYRRALADIVAAHAGRPLTLHAARQIIRFERAAQRVRNALAVSMLPAAWALLRRYRGNPHFAELRSAAEAALVEFVADYDPNRRSSFHTALVWHLRTVLARVHNREHDAARFTRFSSRRERNLPPPGTPGWTNIPADERTLPRSKAAGQRQAARILAVRRILAAGCATLTRRQQEVVDLRFGLDLNTSQNGPSPRPTPQREVARKLGISRAAVGQLQAAALRKLRPFVAAELERES